MRFITQLVKSTAAIAITCAMTAAALYYGSRKKEINEVMVFYKLRFNAFNSFTQLMSHIEAAEKKVSIYMPTIHNPAIQNRLLNLMKRKNIEVKVIIDLQGYKDTTDFFIRELINAGAQVKCSMKPYNMQHKFCLVDDNVLLAGTSNWGDDRSTDYWNYVYITSKPQLVDTVKNEFSLMWNMDVDLDEALRLLTPSEKDSKEDPIHHPSTTAKKPSTVRRRAPPIGSIRWNKLDEDAAEL